MVNPEERQLLPQWQSHKKVWADKITGLAVRGFGEQECPDDTFERWILAGGAIVKVSQELRRRPPQGTDPVGGYYVLYEDGFESWSPAEAFEKGYDRLVERF